MTVNCWSDGLRERLRTVALEAGFSAAGVARVPQAEEPRTSEEADRFADWVEAGYAGEMGYLQRRDEAGRLVRGALHRAMPWARSVVVCAWNYNASGPRSIEDALPGAGWIARYAWMGRRRENASLGSTDYHEELLARLRGVEALLVSEAGCETRCYVDTGPILERDFAAKAGVGWIGRNTCVLNQTLGSWLLLGVVVTSLPVEDGAAELGAADRCGTCMRCVEACPTGALLSSPDPGGVREMDASRCISYLTIEKKGGIDESLRTGVGRNVFGCDICQEVCPWNRKAPVAAAELVEPRAELVNPSLEWLAEMDSAAFKRQFRGSPLERTGRKRLMRNVAIAMGNEMNAPDAGAGYLSRLDGWAAMPGDGAADAALREAAEWARQKIRARTEAAKGQEASASLVGDVDRQSQ